MQNKIKCYFIKKIVINKKKLIQQTTQEIPFHTKIKKKNKEKSIKHIKKNYIIRKTISVKKRLIKKIKTQISH